MPLYSVKLIDIFPIYSFKATAQFEGTHFWAYIRISNQLHVLYNSFSFKNFFITFYA